MELLSPFYAGQEVIAVGAMPGSKFINGHDYIVSECVYQPSPNPIANGKWFWYIGIVGHNNGGAYFRPSIFAPKIPPLENVTFEKITAENPIAVN